MTSDKELIGGVAKAIWKKSSFFATGEWGQGTLGHGVEAMFTAQAEAAIAHMQQCIVGELVEMNTELLHALQSFFDDVPNEGWEGMYEPTQRLVSNTLRNGKALAASLPPMLKGGA